MAALARTHPQFFDAIFVGATMLAFFLFVPVLGARLFIDDWSEA